MDLRTRDCSTEDRKRLGDALTARRVAISPAWANRAEFIRATGISKKLAERLETGKPGNFRTSTLAVIAAAYRVTMESIAATLAGGELVPSIPGAAGGDQHGEDAAITILLAALSDFEAAIMTDPRLRPGERDALIALHRQRGGEAIIAEYRERLRRAREA